MKLIPIATPIANRRDDDDEDDDLDLDLDLDDPVKVRRNLVGDRGGAHGVVVLDFVGVCSVCSLVAGAGVDALVGFGVLSLRSSSTCVFWSFWLLCWFEFG